MVYGLVVADVDLVLWIQVDGVLQCFDAREVDEFEVRNDFRNGFRVRSCLNFLVFDQDLSLTGPEWTPGGTGDSVPGSGDGFLPDSADLTLCVKSGFEFV